MDVYETDSSVTLTIELAGMDQEQIEALVYEDALVIEGQRILPPPESAGFYYTASIRQGPFRIEFPFTCPIDSTQVTATYDRGLLQVTLIKAGGDQT
jgi:HSP20 family protein